MIYKHKKTTDISGLFLFEDSGLIGELVQTTTADGVQLDGFLARNHKSDCWLITHGVNDNFYASSLLREVADSIFQQGFSVLLANNRGHDICAFNMGMIPMRIGSQYESIHKCELDFDAWKHFIENHQGRAAGICAHSLGAVKAAYWLEGRRDVPERVIFLSPPRLRTDLLLRDPKKGPAFERDLKQAQELCETGCGDQVIRVRYPLPNWLSAATFVDKYGQGDKYDYLSKVASFHTATYWLFGEEEVRRGSGNFLDADLNLCSLFERENLLNHRVDVVAKGDHSYRQARVELGQLVSQWISG